MPLTRAAQQTREAQTVRSAPNREGFHCPDIPAVDEHLRTLCERRQADSLTLAGRKRINDDIDVLLLKRWEFTALTDGLSCENTVE